MNKLLSGLWAACVLCVSTPALAQYSAAAGQNAPKLSEVQRSLDAKTGKMVEHTVEREASKDLYGNSQGNQFDLAVDGASTTSGTPRAPAAT